MTWREPGWEQESDEPVVHVGLRDAAAYCEWADARLPTAEDRALAFGLEQLNALAHPGQNVVRNLIPAGPAPERLRDLSIL